MAGEARTQFHQVSVTHMRVVIVIPSFETYLCRYFNVLDTVTTKIKNCGAFLVVRWGQKKWCNRSKFRDGLDFCGVTLIFL